MARTFRHVPFRLDAHLQRLAKSLDLVEIDAALKPIELRAICDPADLLAQAERQFEQTGVNPDDSPRIARVYTNPKRQPKL